MRDPRQSARFRFQTYEGGVGKRNPVLTGTASLWETTCYFKENSPVPWKIELRHKTRFPITIVSAAGFHRARHHVSLDFLSDTHSHKNPFSLSQTKVMYDAGDLMGSWCPAAEAMRTLENDTDPETGGCG